ncbi:hypothetical protein N7470_007110 [Penicillium chermesinum]|nr:hypothetical protein N7470_007110 [Penicillium chermesinum]
MQAWVLIVAAFASAAFGLDNCHCLPSDPCWPSPSEWKSLNATVGGRLIATVPIGSPCHDPTYDAEACAVLRSNWTTPEPHLASSSSVMESYFANQSCDPFTARSKPCTLGNYVSYAVNVSSSRDVIAAIQFAQHKNIRFVIRNTGHDYLGRSTGAGALAVWTHHLNEIEYKEWSDNLYHGPAFKFGAGVMGFQALEAAHPKGLTVVSGDCPAVGLTGGYTQGGGHSTLSTEFGLGADQTLEFEVVTANGTLVTASRSKNSDLYWALSGGGAGNLGVVMSMTVKAHPDAKIAGAKLAFTLANTTTDNFTNGIATFHALLPQMIDQGATVVYQVTSTAFLITSVTAYNKTSTDLKRIFRPFLSALSDLKIPTQVAFYDHDSYYDHYKAFFGPLPYGNIAVTLFQYGGRLIPREVLDSNPVGISNVLRNLTDSGVAAIVGVALDVSSFGNQSNAVFPAWREAAITIQFGTLWNATAPWSEMVADQYKIADDFIPQLEAITPGGGAYENESSFRQHHWKETFFGSTYGRLLAIKKKWDPSSFFYGIKAVGSDAWKVSGSGRMCRA